MERKKIHNLKLFFRRLVKSLPNVYIIMSDGRHHITWAVGIINIINYKSFGEKETRENPRRYKKHGYDYANIIIIDYYVFRYYCYCYYCPETFSILKEINQL